jgi:DNA-binding NarL/FixJ family response regulator
MVALGLLFGSMFGMSELRRSHRLIRSQEQALATASGALAEVIAEHFANWGFTASEREVAMLSLKGLELADIARVRGVAMGTVRAQLAAVYAKSGTSGRAQFTSFFVEDLLSGGIAAMKPEHGVASRAEARQAE